MSRPLQRVQVFVASPGDVTEERDCLKRVIEELNGTLGRQEDVLIELVRWETHAWPGFGEDAQAVINAEIEPFDIFVGIMWRRLGTPTHRSLSGTVEEFERAYASWVSHKRPAIMFYFRTSPFTPTLEELDQIKAVYEFRDSLRKLGALFWEYDGVAQFERLAREHLYRQMSAGLRESSRTAEKQASEDVDKLIEDADELAELVSEEFRPSCRTVAWQQGKPSGGIRAGIVCYTATGPREVRYYQHFNRQSMLRTYGFWLNPTLGVKFVDLKGEPGKDQPYVRANSKGRRYCVAIGEDQLVLHWTNEELLLSAEAHASRSDALEVFNWWLSTEERAPPK
jgi:hypothetical protein